MRELNIDKLSKFNIDIKGNSLFDNMINKIDSLTYESKKNIILKLFYTISIVGISLPLSNNYIENELNKNLNQNINKEEQLTILFENYKTSLENNGMFNLANKISTNLSNIFSDTNQETIADHYIKEFQSIITTSFDGKSIEEKLKNMENEKNNIIEFHGVKKDSYDFKKINEIFNVEKESLLKQLDIINTYNQKIIELKDSKKLHFDNISF